MKKITYPLGFFGKICYEFQFKWCRDQIFWVNLMDKAWGWVIFCAHSCFFFQNTTFVAGIRSFPPHRGGSWDYTSNDIFSKMKLKLLYNRIFNWYIPTYYYLLLCTYTYRFVKLQKVLLKLPCSSTEKPNCRYIMLFICCSSISAHSITICVINL